MQRESVHGPAEHGGADQLDRVIKRQRLRHMLRKSRQLRDRKNTPESKSIGVSASV